MILGQSLTVAATRVEIVGMLRCLFLRSKRICVAQHVSARDGIKPASTTTRFTRGLQEKCSGRTARSQEPGFRPGHDLRQLHGCGSETS